MSKDEYRSTIPAAELAKSRWDYRSHDFIRDMSQAENNFQELYRRRPVERKVKHLWDPRELAGQCENASFIFSPSPAAFIGFFFY